MKKDSIEMFLQKQPYNLTIARHSLDIHQMRVMGHVVKALQPHMTMKADYTKPLNDMWLTINVKELAKNNNIKPLRVALDSLMKKIVHIMHYIPEEATYLEIGTPIIQEFKYKHRTETIKLKISGSLLPQIIDLARGYTKYNLKIAFQTSSPNVYKLYQYIAHFRDVPQITCNIGTLRKFLQIESKYAMPKNIKQRILDPAIRELKEKADVWFEIAERVKDGRRMVGWKFNIYTREKELKRQRSKALKEPNRLLRDIAENFTINNSPEDQRRRGIRELEESLTLTYKLSKRQTALLLSSIDDIKALQQALVDIRQKALKREIKNIGGYTAKVLGEKFNVVL